MTAYSATNREALHRSEIFDLGAVKCRVDVYHETSSTDPFYFELYREEETERGERVWRFIDGSSWDNQDMDLLFNHAVRTYGHHLFNGHVSAPPAPAGVPPTPKIGPNDIPTAGTPNAQ
jgi:hypothetical protein